VRQPGLSGPCRYACASSELTQHRCLHFSHLTQGARWQFQRDDEHCEVTVSPVFSANNGRALHQAALAGAGIVYHTSFLAARDIAAGRLQVVLPDWQVPLNHLTALYPATRRLAPAVRALIDLLVVNSHRYRNGTNWLDCASV
jgi:DNA-binding transcriptional LysR family regulator